MCRQPVRPENSHAVAGCQDLILSDHVVEAVMEYYDENILPPIQTPKRNYGVQIPELKDDTPGITVPKVQLIKVTPETVNKKVKVPAAPEESRKPESNPVEILRDPSVDIRDQKPYQKVHPYEIKKEESPTIQRKLAVMDDPIIGGKLTVCVLCYGPHTELARKCLGSLFASIPADRLDVRVATNQAPQATIDYLRTLPITKLYINSENRHKYPVMREMFYDEKRPIETNYFMWLDDDTWVVKPQWIDDLCQTIINNHHYNFRMYGNLMYHDLKHYSKSGGRPDQWFKAAKWYRNKQFRVRGGQVEAPNGSVIDFAVGWCWAMETAAMRAANVPCSRLGHNGGDITIGEQMHQAGYGIKQWNRGKSLIACPSREQGGRRGYSERFPWDPSR